MKAQYLFYMLLVFNLTACMGGKESSQSSTSSNNSQTSTGTPAPTPTPTPMPTATPAGPDVTAPTLVISAPSASGQTFLSASINIIGSASDTSGIQSVTVNGAAASGTTSWSKSVTLVAGSNSFTIVATDNSPAHNTKTQTITAIYTPAAAGAPTAPTSLVLFNPTASNGLVNNPTITINGVTSGNQVYLALNDSSCANFRAVGTAAGSSINLSAVLPSYGTHVFYAKQVTPQGLSSPCSTASVSYLYGILPPTSLSMFNPSSNSGTINKPTITIGGIPSGNRAYLYSDANCTTSIGVSSGLSTGSSANITTNSLPVGSTTFYATRYYIDPSTNYGYTSACSTASVTYTYVVPDAPTSLSMYMPQSTTGTNANPVIAVGGVLDGNTISLYSDSACSTLRGSAVASTGAAITSSTVAVGATTFYAKQTRADGAASRCSTASVTYNYTGPGAAPTPPLQSVSQMSTGYETTCAIVGGGKLKCWGKNSFGELKNGTTTPSSVPVDIPGLESGVTAVGNGNSVICAIQSGVLKCWGNPSATVVGTYSSDIFVKMALTKSHVCAITSTAALKCFGEAFGQKTVTTGLDSGVTAVSVSNEYSCAVQNGALKCWGCNYSSPREALGIGDFTADCSKPAQVIGLESGVTAVSQVDEQVTCAIQNSALKCWGTSAAGMPATPTVIPGFESGVSYTQGRCAIKGGQYKCFTNMPLTGVLDLTAMSLGYTYNLGISGVINSADSHLSANAHNCYLLDAGAMKCKGGNNNGQLGNGSTVNSSVLVTPSGF